ncbi:MAG: glycogen debranching protein GlgX [Acidimicrobiia bacterium]|nr:glycogen debranching protein GlgX [Acidimicrobiia bacterium]
MPERKTVAPKADADDAPVPEPRHWVGRPYPLGATYDGAGTNFSLFTSVAEGVELCLLDDDGTERRLGLTEVDGHCWHAYLPDVRPGQRYGYRVHGPWDPDAGQWCNPAKLLLDPYAKAVEGEVDWDVACFPYEFDDPDRMSEADSAPHVPRGVVSDPFFDWGNDRPPDHAMHETIVYETHVRGLTMTHPAIPEEIRGTYSAIAHPAIVGHLTSLGMTSIELMPVHQFVHDHHLVERGLRNYWGYNSIAFLAPHNGYSATAAPGRGTGVLGQVQEFKAMVKALHSAGIEVILDVVYNHTAEGNHMGPMLSLRGIDNQAYYRTVDGEPRYYLDFTGTGNSMNMRHPHVLQLIMDSLRYWVTEMHVDGFRFDLASTLARELYAVDRLSVFFDLVQQDPTVSQVKLIAEPWDVGEGGYQIGNFPPLWSEWNGRYRDTIRDFWRGEPATLAEFGFRFTGSSDLYQSDSRRPTASVNFVTAHDGFTLTDLASYNDKHNEANGEDNRDGESYNRSWNCGHGPQDDGPTKDESILALRERQRRNVVTTLMLSQGVPMLLGGDELGRTQHGNNNAYCQDNDVSWFDWEHVDEEFLAWCRRVAELRTKHPVFRRRRWFQGREIRATEDVEWFRPDGVSMDAEDWEMGFARAVGVLLDGAAIATPDAYGGRIIDDSFFVMFNASEMGLEWTVPKEGNGDWIVELDTSQTLEPGATVDGGAEVRLVERSMVVLRTAPVVEATR